MHADHPPSEDGREPLPQHTTPTWEMELLISGATVFSLLQLPDLLDHGFYSMFPRFDASLTTVIMLPYAYLLATTYALIATFVLHLATRAYWVALVGLRSIYPEGVDWDRLRWGPAYKRAVSDQFPSLAIVVERADNRASQVFGFGIGFAMMVLAPLFVMVVLTVVTYVIFEATGRVLALDTAWAIVTGVFFLPFFAALLVDRVGGDRLAPDGLLARLNTRIVERYINIGFSNFTNYPVLLFFSRFGQYRSAAITTVGIMLVLTLVFGRLMSREDVLRLDGYIDLPPLAELRGHSLNPRNYADQRGDGLTLRQHPFIQSEQIDEDYVRLFVPYNAARDATAMAQLCDEPSPNDEADNGAALLRCAAAIHAVSIDGTPVALQFDMGVEPALGVRGFVAMIDVAALPRGRHVLQVARVPLPDDAAPAPGTKPPRVYDIVFWR